MTPLETFKAAFQQLDKDHLELLDRMYAEDIKFIDPAHSLTGLDEVKNYFSKLYQNVDSITFVFDNELVSEHQATLEWTMNFTHPRLANNRKITVSGCSWLKFSEDGKVIYHRDFFDLGAMLYEHIPLLGRIINKIRQGLGS